jgi:hypothetical protein
MTYVNACPITTPSKPTLGIKYNAEKYKHRARNKSVKI